MSPSLVMTGFACPFFLISVFLGSSAYAYSSSVSLNSYPALQRNPPTTNGGGSDWQISATREVQSARSSQNNAARRRQPGNVVYDHYQKPNKYKTLPDEVLHNYPPFPASPVSHFQSLEYEANNYRPATKYPQSIEAYSHNYGRQPAIYEEQYQRRPNQSPLNQFSQQNSIFDPTQNQRPNSSPYVQLEQQQTQSNYIDYPPYPNQNVKMHQVNPNQNTLPNPYLTPNSHHQQPPYLGSPTFAGHLKNSIQSPQYPAQVPFASQFASPFAQPAYNTNRFPPMRQNNPPSFAYSQSHQPTNPSHPPHEKTQNPYFYPSAAPAHLHSHRPQSHANHPPSYYDPDPELTAELQQLDKEYHAEREGLSSGKSVFRLLVPLLMLGFSLPALGYMYTYMNRRRGFRSEKYQSSERLQYYSHLLSRAVECYQQSDKCLEHDQ